MDRTEVDDRLRAWKELMDFGWEFCVKAYAQLHPGRDPLELLREAYERMSVEHAAANERMLTALGRSLGGADRC